MMQCRYILLAVTFICGLSYSAQADDSVKIVNLYSAQKEHLIRPVLEMFTDDSGIKVNLVTGKPEALLTRIEHEGEHSPADILLTADIGNIIQAEKKGLLQPVISDMLEANIPDYLQAKDNRWFALTKRVRALFVRKGDDAPGSYIDIASADYGGGVLVRSSSNVYNQSLVSYMIHHHGKAATQAWVNALVKNMAREPQGGDRDQIKALAAGEGRVAIANSYYFGILTGGDESLQDAASKEHIAIIFPNQDNIGVHTNIRGGGVLTHASNKKEAIALLEFLSSPAAQRVFADENFEYPVHPDVEPSPLLASWGDVVMDNTPLDVIAAHQHDAMLIMDKAGWK